MSTTNVSDQAALRQHNHIWCAITKANMAYLQLEHDVIMQHDDVLDGCHDIITSMKCTQQTFESVRLKLLDALDGNDQYFTSFLDNTLGLYCASKAEEHSISKWLQGVRSVQHAIEHVRMVADTSMDEINAILNNNDNAIYNDVRGYMQTQPFVRKWALNTISTKLDMIRLMLECSPTCKSKSGHELLRCDVCKQPMHNPVVFPCSHHMCRCCSGGQKQCPVCVSISSIFLTQQDPINDSLWDSVLNQHDMQRTDCHSCDILIATETKSVDESSNESFSYFAGTCHQCKRRRPKVVACEHSSCRKNYCDGCLRRHYPSSNMNPCPSCGGQCKCRQCDKEAVSRRKLNSSCHQCKRSYPVNDVLLCRGEKCRKKYCRSCVDKYLFDSNTSNVLEKGYWPNLCPSCRSCCSCAKCVRKNTTAI